MYFGLSAGDCLNADDRHDSISGPVKTTEIYFNICNNKNYMILETTFVDIFGELCGLCVQTKK